MPLILTEVSEVKSYHALYMRIKDVVPPAVGLELLDAVASATGLVAPDADEAGGGIDAAEDLSGAALGSAWRWLVDADAGVEVRVGSGDEAGGDGADEGPEVRGVRDASGAEALAREHELTVASAAEVRDGGRELGLERGAQNRPQQRLHQPSEPR